MYLKSNIGIVLKNSRRRFNLSIRAEMITTTSSKSNDELFNCLAKDPTFLPKVSLVTKRKIFDDLYEPVYKFVKDSVLNKKQTEINASTSPPVFIGLSAPQGCGKTTLVDVLCTLCKQENISVAAMSLDDFYHTGEEQERLAEKHQHNSLLQYRGNAGTHDLQLLNSTLASFSSQNSDTSGITSWVPRFDKSLRGGRGDRLPPAQWTPVQKPVDIVLVEGWMLGFAAFPEDSAEANCLSDEMKEVNRYLLLYRPLHCMFAAWVVMAVEDVASVFAWRLQAEHNMKSIGKPGMSDDQVRDFVSRFMPAYQAYLPALYAQGPECAASKHAPVLKITVDKDREPTGMELMQI